VDILASGRRQSGHPEGGRGRFSGPLMSTSVIQGLFGRSPATADVHFGSRMASSHVHFPPSRSFQRPTACAGPPSPRSDYRRRPCAVEFVAGPKSVLRPLNTPGDFSGANTSNPPKESQRPVPERNASNEHLQWCFRLKRFTEPAHQSSLLVATESLVPGLLLLSRLLDLPVEGT
jgi:hypothetical protein